MNINTYASHYSNFHHCTVAELKNNMIVFDLACSLFDPFTVSRMIPPKSITVNSDKPFILALKAHFKSELPASIMCNEINLWTICLGKERWIQPITRDLHPEGDLHLYATTLFVKNPEIIKHYLKDSNHVHPHIYYVNNTVLYLDNQDLPYPGGSYFDKCEPTPFYRICFLTTESTDYVSKLMLQWESRRDVQTIQSLTRTTTAMPKFIDFQPVLEVGLFESSIISNGLVHRKLSAKKPELIIQDILLSYYKNFHREESNKMCLGLIMEWPLSVCFEGAWTPQKFNDNRKIVALSINGNQPKQIIYVIYPYDRYVEYKEVPAIPWTPVSFVHSAFITDIHIKKVVLDTIILGVVYKDAFFCFSQPLLEGHPAKTPALNSQYLLSVAPTECFMEDPNIRIIQTYRLNDHYSLHRVNLANIPYETWCISKQENKSHPILTNIPLPNLVKQWLDFFMRVKQQYFDININMVRLALTLSKHNVCYNLHAEKNKNKAYISENQIKFYFHEDVIQFINDARLASKSLNKEESSFCTIS